MGPVGVQEMIVIFLVALILFGPKKLPELGRTVGKALTEFRKAQSELKATFESHMREIEREGESIKQVAESVHSDLYDSHQYDSPYYDPGAYSSEPYQLAASNPSTVGESATQDAEYTVSHESSTAEPSEEVPAVNGTVARGTHAEHTDAHLNDASEHPVQG